MKRLRYLFLLLVACVAFGFAPLPVSVAPARRPDAQRRGVRGGGRGSCCAGQRVPGWDSLVHPARATLCQRGSASSSQLEPSEPKLIRVKSAPAQFQPQHIEEPSTQPVLGNAILKTFQSFLVK